MEKVKGKGIYSFFYKQIGKVKNQKIRNFLVVLMYQLELNLLQILISLTILTAYSIVTIVVNVVSSGTSEFQMGMNDMMLAIWGLVVGLVFFGFVFNFAIVNGTSRKNFYLSSTTLILAVSIVWSLIGSLAMFLFNLAAPQMMLYKFMYNMSFIGLWCWTFGIVFVAMCIGWLIRGLLYRFKLINVIMVGAGLLVAIGALVIIDAVIGWVMADGMAQFFLAVLGLKLASPSPYIAMAFFVGIGLICLGAMWLLVRRLELKKGYSVVAN